MRQSGDICLYMSFAHAVRLRVASRLWRALFTLVPAHFVRLLFFFFPETHPKLHRKETVIQPQHMRVFQLSSGVCSICVHCRLHLPKFALWHWFKRFIAEQSLLLCARVGGYEILLFPYLLDEHSGCEMDHTEEAILKGWYRKGVSLFCDHAHTAVDTVHL